MNIIVLNRRSITFRQVGRGEVVVLLVPGQDQIQIVKDLAGLSDEALQGRASSGRGPQLSRVYSGQRYIYGYLPEEIRELRGAVKVWLAEDYAPADCKAFFFIFNDNIVIHGVSEKTDEGLQFWRTAQLTMGANNSSGTIGSFIADYAVSNPDAKICVAVLNQLDLYQQLQKTLVDYQITPVPFTTLKHNPEVRPLYRHVDYSLIFSTGVLLSAIIFMSCVGFYFVNWSEKVRLEEEVVDIESQIRNIQLNQSTGHVREPQLILDTMAKVFNQQPSALIDAAASMASNFGDLAEVAFSPPEFTGSSNQGVLQQKLKVKIEKGKYKLLVEQEKRAQNFLSQTPWIRQVVRTGAPGNALTMDILLQSEGAPLPSAELVSSSLGGRSASAATSESTVSPTNVGDDQ